MSAASGRPASPAASPAGSGRSPARTPSAGPTRRGLPGEEPEERERILSDVWDNLARMTMEYPFIQELVEAFDPDRPTGG